MQNTSLERRRQQRMDFGCTDRNPLTGISLRSLFELWFFCEKFEQKKCSISRISHFWLPWNTSHTEPSTRKLDYFTHKMVMPQMPYPAVKPNPTLDDCFRAARFSDYMQWVGATVATWGFGFIRGKPARFAFAGLMAGVGFTFGSIVLVQNTRGRLMGLRENAREVKMYSPNVEE